MILDLCVIHQKGNNFKIINIYIYNYCFRYSRTVQYPQPVVSVSSSDNTGRYLRAPTKGR